MQFVAVMVSKILWFIFFFFWFCVLFFPIHSLGWFMFFCIRFHGDWISLKMLSKGRERTITTTTINRMVGTLVHGTQYTCTHCSEWNELWKYIELIIKFEKYFRCTIYQKKKKKESLLIWSLILYFQAIGWPTWIEIRYYRILINKCMKTEWSDRFHFFFLLVLSLSLLLWMRQLKQVIEHFLPL